MRIPFDDRIEKPGGISHGNTVNPNYGMRGLAINDQIAAIDKQTADMMGNAMNNAFKTGREIYTNYKEGQNSADLAAAKRLVYDYEQQMSEEIRQVNDPNKVREITQRYDEKIKKTLEGNNADGLPYFNNPEAKKLFTEKFLTDRIGNWHRSGSEQAFQLNIRNSKARLQLDIDGAMKSPDLDNPEVKATIDENLSKLSHFGVTANEIQVRKEKAYTQLDMKRAQNYHAALDATVDQLVKSESDPKAGVQQAIAQAKKQIAGLDNMSMAQKEAYYNDFDKFEKIAVQKQAMQKAEYDKYMQEMKWKNYDIIRNMRLDGADYDEQLQFVRENREFLPEKVIDTYADGVQKQMAEENRINEINNREMEALENQRMNQGFDAGMLALEQIEKKKIQDKWNVEGKQIFLAANTYRPEEDKDLSVYMELNNKLALMKRRNDPLYEDTKDLLDAAAPSKLTEKGKSYAEGGQDLFKTTLNLEVITGGESHNKTEAAIREDWNGLGYHERLDLYIRTVRPYNRLIKEKKYDAADKYLHEKKVEIEELITSRKLQSHYYKLKNNPVQTTNKQIPRYREAGTGRIYQLIDGKKVYE
jgi:hypothetical protein